MTIVGRLRAAGCVFAEDEARLLKAAADTPAELAAMVRRRVAGVPLEHIVGWVEFCGQRIGVDPGVFVPRRRSELLVREAVACAGAQAVVVELCCGAAAVATVLIRRLPHARIYAADIDPVAVRCARRNLAGRAEVLQGDLYAALPAALRGRVDVLIANAPYVPTAAIALMPPEARLHEPRRALDGGADGLDVQRRVAAAAGQWLAPGGHLLIETGAHQASQTAAQMRRYGLTTRRVHSADSDATVVVGTCGSSRRPSPGRPS